MEAVALVCEHMVSFFPGKVSVSIFPFFFKFTYIDRFHLIFFYLFVPVFHNLFKAIRLPAVVCRDLFIKSSSCICNSSCLIQNELSLDPVHMSRSWFNSSCSFYITLTS